MRDEETTGATALREQVRARYAEAARRVSGEADGLHSAIVKATRP